MNYGEEYAYLYLRLNGFFPIRNFVVHRAAGTRYSYDIDLLAIRLPYVFEETGGQDTDWDSTLLKELAPGLMTGIICEVKTGRLNDNELFNEERLGHCLDRFGFMPNFSSDQKKQVIDNKCTDFEFNGSKFQVLKLLVSNQRSNRKDFLQLRIQHLREFIENRVQKYEEKWQDRMFFPSVVMQDIIDRQRQTTTPK